MAQENLFTIKSGSSKFDLMLSLFDGNKTPRRTVTFRLEGGAAALSQLDPFSIEVAINSVSQEDGSGESWMFRGFAMTLPRRFAVNGYFRTSTREGWLKFVDEHCQQYKIELTCICEHQYCAKLIFDTLSSICGYGDSNASAVKNVFDRLHQDRGWPQVLPIQCEITDQSASILA